MLQKEFRLTNLLGLEEWQGIQDSLSESLEITIRTFCFDGALISKTSRPNQNLEEILPDYFKNFKFFKNALSGAKMEDLRGLNDELDIKCPFGLDIFIVPIKAVGDNIVAYVMLGPVILKTRKDIFEYSKEAEDFGINSEKLLDALIDINVFSYNKTNALIKTAKNIFSYVAQSAYHKKRLAEITPEMTEVDPAFAMHYEEKILNCLLTACTLSMDADSGSVMTLDRNTNMLHIKVSTKLDSDIVDKTNIKVGEGIAGMAAATSESIILPKDQNKKGLSNKMKRQYIKSSLIVPFNMPNAREVYGVINLNIVRKEKEFSERDIALVKEFVNMASTALSPFNRI